MKNLKKLFSKNNLSEGWLPSSDKTSLSRPEKLTKILHNWLIEGNGAVRILEWQHQVFFSFNLSDPEIDHGLNRPAVRKEIKWDGIIPKNSLKGIKRLGIDSPIVIDGRFELFPENEMEELVKGENPFIGGYIDFDSNGPSLMVSVALNVGKSDFHAIEKLISTHLSHLVMVYVKCEFHPREEIHEEHLLQSRAKASPQRGIYAVKSYEISAFGGMKEEEIKREFIKKYVSYYE